MQDTVLDKPVVEKHFQLLLQQEKCDLQQLLAALTRASATYIQHVIQSQARLTLQGAPLRNREDLLSLREVLNAGSASSLPKLPSDANLQHIIDLTRGPSSP